MLIKAHSLSCSTTPSRTCSSCTSTPSRLFSGYTRRRSTFITERKMWQRWVRVSKREGTKCHLCGGEITPGTDIFPSDLGTWSHLSCCGSPPATPLCKHGWECARRQAGTCWFRHSEQLLSRPKTKGDRTGVFRRWLVDTFGVEKLNEGTGVLDGAAGKGALSFELVRVAGVRAFAVEPRPLQLARCRRKMEYGLYERSSPPCMIEHVRVFFEHPMADFAPARCVRKDSDRTGWVFHDDDDSDDRQVVQDDEEAAVASSERARHLIDNCSVVVGMHPDQATEHLVDFALDTGKAFAVVPCCVHSKERPNRTAPDGAPVRSFQSFIAYLCDKSPLIQTAELPIPGRNVVVFQSS